MIRLATMADRKRAVELLADSRVGAGFDAPDGATGFVFPFVPEYAERLFVLHLRGQRLALVHDVKGVAQGILLAAAFEHHFGPVWMAKETLWWIGPAHRGGTAAVRMLDAFEAWSRDCHCKFAGMAGMGDDPRVAALYERRGYKRAETHFLKTVA